MVAGSRSWRVPSRSWLMGSGADNPLAGPVQSCQLVSLREIEKRLPLGGSRRIFWDDGSEDAIGDLLDIFEALREKFRVSSVKADVVRAACPSLQANRVAYNKRHGLGFRLSNALCCFAAPF